MGWSMAVTVKPSKHQEMLDFLEKHFRPESDADNRRYAKYPSDCTKYVNSKKSIGFNNPTDYEYAVLRWVAFRVGVQRKFHRLLGKNAPAVPYVRGEEDSVPVIPRGTPNVPEEMRNLYEVDAKGWRPIHAWWVATTDPKNPAYNWLQERKDKADAFISTEITRLDFLWRNIKEIDEACRNNDLPGWVAKYLPDIFNRYYIVHRPPYTPHRLPEDQERKVLDEVKAEVIAYLLKNERTGKSDRDFFEKPSHQMMEFVNSDLKTQWRYWFLYNQLPLATKNPLQDLLEKRKT